MPIRGKLLQVDIPPELHRKLIAKAQSLGVSKSDFVRMTIIKALEPVPAHPTPTTDEQPAQVAG